MEVNRLNVDTLLRNTSDLKVLLSIVWMGTGLEGTKYIISLTHMLVSWVEYIVVMLHVTKETWILRQKSLKKNSFYEIQLIVCLQKLNLVHLKKAHEILLIKQ